MAGVYQYEIELKSNVAKLLTDMKEVQDRLDSVEGREYKVNLGIDSKKLENVISNLDKMLTRLGRGTSDFKEFENLSKQLNTIVSEVQALNKEFGKINDSGISSLVSSIRNIDSSLTSLREHIVGVNKDFGNIGKNAGNNTSQINEAKKATEGLANATKELNNVQKDSGGKSNNTIVDTGYLNTVINLFSQIESHLGTMRKIFADVGDGEEFSPLLKTINNVQSAILELSQSMSKIKLNVNMDLGSVATEKIDTKIAETNNRRLEAYRKLFSSMKSTGKTNKEMLQFFEPDDRGVNELVGMYQDMIQRAEKQFSTTKIKNGRTVKSNIYKDLLGSDYKKEVELARDAFNRATSKKNNTDGISELFGKVDLSEVISQLGLIVSKLDEISVAASGLKTAFSDGLNVTASVDEIEKLTSRVKELEEELSRVKLSSASIGNKSNISSGTPMKDVFQGESKAATEASASAIKEESKALEQVANTAKEASSSKTQFASANKEVKASAESSSSSLEEERAKIKEVGESADDVKKSLDNVVFKPNTEGFDEIVAKLGLAKEKASEIAKITKSSVWSESNGKYLESYNIRYKNGSSEIRGESTDNNGSNVLRANEVAYEAKAFSDLWEEANKVNNALNETRDIMSSLGRMPELGSQFSTLESKIVKLNNRLTSGSDNFSVSDYKNEVKSLTSEYSELVKIQQKRDVETYNQATKDSNAQKLTEQKKAYSELTEAINRYSTVSKRIAGGNALSTDQQEAKDLLKTINELRNKGVLSQEQLDSSESKLKNIKQTCEDIKKITKESTIDSLQSEIDSYNTKFNNWNVKPTNQNRSVEYQTALNEYKASIDLLVEEKKRLSQLDVITDKDLEKTKELRENIQKNADAIKAMSAAEKGSTLSARSKEIDKISKYLKENTKLSEEAKQKLREYIRILQEGGGAVNVEEINNAFLKVVATEREAGREGKSFLDIFKNKALYGFASQLAMYYLSFYDFVRYARNAINAIRELDTALIDLKKTTTMSDSQLESFYYSSNDVAKEMGVTTAEIINQASAWSRFNKIDPLYSNVY